MLPEAKCQYRILNPYNFFDMLFATFCMLHHCLQLRIQINVIWMQVIHTFYKDYNYLEFFHTWRPYHCLAVGPFFFHTEANRIINHTLPNLFFLFCNPNRLVTELNYLEALADLNYTFFCWYHIFMLFVRFLLPDMFSQQDSQRRLACLA